MEQAIEKGKVFTIAIRREDKELNFLEKGVQFFFYDIIFTKRVCRKNRKITIFRIFSNTT